MVNRSGVEALYDPETKRIEIVTGTVTLRLSDTYGPGESFLWQGIGLKPWEGSAWIMLPPCRLVYKRRIVYLGNEKGLPPGSPSSTN